MKINTHSTFTHWFLLISNTNQLIVIDHYWSLLIIIDFIDYWLSLIDIAGTYLNQFLNKSSLYKEN